MKNNNIFAVLVCFIVMGDVLLFSPGVTFPMKLLIGFCLIGCFILAMIVQEKRYGKVNKSRIMMSLVFFTTTSLINYFIPDLAWYWKGLIAGLIGGLYGCMAIAIEKRSL